MKTITTMNLARTVYIETLNELLYAIIYCSGRDHDENKLQQEKDKFAIEFAEWLGYFYIQFDYGVYFHKDELYFINKQYKSTSSLLDIYKEELSNKK